jgi:uncharacterized protein
LLERIISSRARIELLKKFLMHSDGRFYMRELGEITGLPHGSVQRELGNLEKAGVILRERGGRQVYYRINNLCPIVHELRSIIIKTVGVADVLRNALRPLAGSIKAAFIFGSFAAGNVKPESDVDLLIIGEISLRQIVSALGDSQKLIGRDINPVVFHLDEFKSRIKEKDHFLCSIIETQKIFLAGDDNGLSGLIQQG